MPENKKYSELPIKLILDGSEIFGLDDVGLDAHTSVDGVLKLGEARFFRKDDHISTSTGGSDNGKPIVLDGTGVIDPSLIAPGALTGGVYIELTDNTDHTHTVALSNQDVLDLVDGVVGNVLKSSTVANTVGFPTHSHDVVINYNATTGQFEGVVATNHGHGLLTINRGDTGSTGNDGTNGTDGSNGAPGVDGIDGADGIDGEQNPTEASTAEAEAGTETALRSWSPVKVKEAIEALGGSGGGSLTESFKLNYTLSGTFSSASELSANISDITVISDVNNNLVIQVTFGLLKYLPSSMIYYGYSPDTNQYKIKTPSGISNVSTDNFAVTGAILTIKVDRDETTAINGGGFPGTATNAIIKWTF